MALLEIRDQLAAARDLVGCLYLACQHVQSRDERAALSAVSYDLREKLRAIGASLEDIIGNPANDREWGRMSGE